MNQISTTSEVKGSDKRQRSTTYKNEIGAFCGTFWGSGATKKGTQTYDAVEKCARVKFFVTYGGGCGANRSLHGAFVAPGWHEKHKKARKWAEVRRQLF